MSCPMIVSCATIFTYIIIQVGTMQYRYPYMVRYRSEVQELPVQVQYKLTRYLYCTCTSIHTLV